MFCHANISWFSQRFLQQFQGIWKKRLVLYCKCSPLVTNSMSKLFVITILGIHSRLQIYSAFLLISVLRLGQWKVLSPVFLDHPVDNHLWHVYSYPVRNPDESMCKLQLSMNDFSWLNQELIIREMR